MAEVLGLVSSVITVVQVAGKLGTSAFKLKRLWDEVHDVPASIRRCLEELELLAPALEDIDTEFQRTRHIVQQDRAAQRSLEYARKAMEKLEGMAEDMQKQIESARKHKKFLVQLKVRLKKDMIDEQQQQLQHALRLLSMSQNTYMMALMRLPPSISMSEFRAMQEQCRLQEAPQPRAIEEDGEDPETHTGNSSNSDWSRAVARTWLSLPSIPWKNPGFLWRFDYRVTETETETPAYVGAGKTKVFQARLQFPSWLLHHAWDFQVLKAYDGWKLQLKTWNTIPDDSAVFRYARQGRVDLVLQLFEENEASLYDRMADGFTLLDVGELIAVTRDYHEANGGVIIQAAMESGNLELVTTLSSMGLKPTQLAANYLCFSIVCCYVRVRTGNDDVMHLIRNWNEEEEFIGADFDGYLSEGLWSDNEQWVLQFLIWQIPGLLDLFFPCLDFLEIVEVVNGVLWFVVDPHVLREIVKSDKHISPATFRAVISRLSWGSLFDFAWAYFHAFLHDWRTEMEHRRSLARWMLAGATAREIARPEDWTTHGLPLFCWAVKGVCRQGVPYRSLSRWLMEALSMWLEDLAEAGVDLEEYIQWEIATCRGEFNLDPATEIRPGIRFFESGPSLTVLAHGRRPRDWRFEWDPCVEEFAGEFWKAVDAPEKRMPGAWVDDIEVFHEGCKMGLVGDCFFGQYRNVGRRDATTGATWQTARGIPRCDDQLRSIL